MVPVSTAEAPPIAAKVSVGEGPPVGGGDGAGESVNGSDELLAEYPFEPVMVRLTEYEPTTVRAAQVMSAVVPPQP